MSKDGKICRRLTLSRPQIFALQEVVREKFSRRERFFEALEFAVRGRGYHEPALYILGYPRHLSGRSVSVTAAKIYLEVLGDDSRLYFFRDWLIKF
jgi:hypothetical protein